VVAIFAYEGILLADIERSTPLAALFRRLFMPPKSAINLDLVSVILKVLGPRQDRLRRLLVDSPIPVSPQTLISGPSHLGPGFLSY
jgi:hypothetical protein